MNSTNQTGPAELETLLGGIEYDAAKLDGSTERVKILQLPLNRLEEYARLQDNEPAMIELLCSRPTGWSASLKNESAESIIIEGERLNEKFFSAWWGRRVARQAAFVASLPEKLRAPSAPMSPSSPAQSA